jgi:hypothetical protein
VCYQKDMMQHNVYRGFVSLNFVLSDVYGAA